MSKGTVFVFGMLVGVALFALMSFAYVREGQNSTNKIQYMIDGKYIREGQTSYGKILYNIDGNYIREGQTSYGKILYNITKN